MSCDCISPAFAYCLLLSDKFAQKKKNIIDLTTRGASRMNELCLVTENIWESMQSAHFFSRSRQSSDFFGGFQFHFNLKANSAAFAMTSAQDRGSFIVLKKV